MDVLIRHQFCQRDNFYISHVSMCLYIIYTIILYSSFKHNF